MLGFHPISAAPISALLNRVVTAVAETIPGGWLLHSRRWSASNKSGKLKHFDTPEAALAYSKQEPKRKSKEIKSLGKAQVFYKDEPVESYEILGKTGLEVIEHDKRMIAALMALIDLQLKQIEDEELLFILAAAFA